MLGTRLLCDSRGQRVKKITIACGCFNEEENLPYFFREIEQAFSQIASRYTYEIIIADNDSTDRSREILRRHAAINKNIKVIFNTRNFGASRSGYNALLHATGDAAIMMATDLQDPPNLICDLIKEWEQGSKVVMAVKANSDEPKITFALRTVYYKTLAAAANINLVPHFHGFGLYDKAVIETLRALKDPQPFFRGLIADIGHKPSIISFTQPQRLRGKSKHNFFQLYEEGILGITSYTKLPLRLATAFGFFSASLSLIIGIIYLFYKLLYWDSFIVGSAPVAIGLFLFSSVQLIFLGVIGEYISIIYTQVLKRPPVFEGETINFDHGDSEKDRR